MAAADVLIGVYEPYTWTEEDDPRIMQEVPDCEARAEKVRCEAAWLVSEVLHLLGTARPDQIAAQLGYTSPHTLHHRLVACGRPDLARKFDRSAWDVYVSESARTRYLA